MNSLFKEQNPEGCVALSRGAGKGFYEDENDLFQPGRMNDGSRE